jgi:pimeloyl-ACP methyl ester carboxylesterase
MPNAAQDLRTRLLAGCAVRERRLDLAGTSSVVFEAGDGSPLVLLHGGIECGGVYWAKVIAPLAARHRVVVPDVPGLGESAPFPRMDLAHFVDWFDALLRETCREPPWLVAHSMFGSLAARFTAQARADALRGLVIYAAPGVARYRLPVGLLLAAIRFGIRPSQRNIERFAQWAFVPSEAARRPDREWFEALLAYVLACANVAHVQRTMRQLIRIGKQRIPDEELHRIAIPTALLWGRYDRMVPLRVAEDAHARLGWPLHVVDEVGHVPHVDCPDPFLRALRDAFGPTAALDAPPAGTSDNA